MMDQIGYAFQIVLAIGMTAGLVYGAIWWTPWYQKIRNNCENKKQKIRENRNEVTR